MDASASQVSPGVWQVVFAPRDDSDPIRHGGWSFAPAENGYNDIVVYETVDGISRLVTRFPYSAEQGRWLYPDELPDDTIWSRPQVVWNAFAPIERSRLFESQTSFPPAGAHPTDHIRAFAHGIAVEVR